MFYKIWARRWCSYFPSNQKWFHNFSPVVKVYLLLTQLEAYVTEMWFIFSKEVLLCCVWYGNFYFPTSINDYYPILKGRTPGRGHFSQCRAFQGKDSGHWFCSVGRRSGAGCNCPWYYFSAFPSEKPPLAPNQGKYTDCPIYFFGVREEN